MATAPALLIYAFAALAEIAGCFAVWAWWRQGASPWWLIVAGLALAAFAWALALSPADMAGRAFAAYGGIYVAASILWLWVVEQTRPDRFDLLGSALVLAGAGVILFAPRS